MKILNTNKSFHLYVIRIISVMLAVVVVILFILAYMAGSSFAMKSKQSEAEMLMEQAEDNINFAIASIRNYLQYVDNIDGCEYNLTMLRSVSGKFPVHDDCFLTFENENADCKGIFTAKYALYFHNKNEIVSKEAKKYITSTSVMQMGHGQGGKLPKQISFVKSDFEISCIKLSESGDGVIIRIFNPCSEKKIGNLYLHGSKKAFLCTLAEEKLEEIEMKNNEMNIELEPFKIATVFFKL